MKRDAHDVSFCYARVMPADHPWQTHSDGVTLRVKAVPRSARTSIRGVVALPDGPALAAAIAAPPADGAANTSLIETLAKLLGVSRSAVTLQKGSSSRIKRLHVMGDAAELATKLEALFGQCSVSR